MMTAIVCRLSSGCGTLPRRRVARMRILLVEDEPSAARFIAKGLREATYAVVVATDGVAAAEQCQQYDYDAIVLDVMLPGRDGLSVCREIRASGSDVPVLMLTARDA